MGNALATQSLVAVLGLMASYGGGGDPVPSAEQVAEANRSTIDSLETFSCRYTTTYTVNEYKRSTQGEYWRSRDADRVRTVERDGVFEMSKQNSEVRTLKSAAGHKSFGTVQAGQGLVFQPDHDPWKLSLFTIFYLGTPREHLRFDQLLQKGQKIGAVSWKND